MILKGALTRWIGGDHRYDSRPRQTKETLKLVSDSPCVALSIVGALRVVVVTVIQVVDIEALIWCECEAVETKNNNSRYEDNNNHFEIANNRISELSDNNEYLKILF